MSSQLSLPTVWQQINIWKAPENEKEKWEKYLVAKNRKRELMKP